MLRISSRSVFAHFATFWFIGNSTPQTDKRFGVPKVRDGFGLGCGKCGNMQRRGHADIRHFAYFGTFSHCFTRVQPIAPPPQEGRSCTACRRGLGVIVFEQRGRFAHVNLRAGAR